VNEPRIQDRVWKRCSEALFDALNAGATYASLSVITCPFLAIRLSIELQVADKPTAHQRHSWDHNALAAMHDDALYAATCGIVPGLMQQLHEATEDKDSADIPCSVYRCPNCGNYFQFPINRTPSSCPWCVADMTAVSALWITQNTEAVHATR